MRRGRPERRPAARFGHTYPSIMAGFYELRTTNNEPRLFPRIQMRRSAATDSNGQRRFGEPSARSGPPLQDGPYGCRYTAASQTDNIASSNPRLVKKCPDRGHRRGRPERRPAARFGHTYPSIMAGFYEPRTTNNEPRLFPRTQMRRSAATDSNGQRRFGMPSARSGPPLQDGPYRYRCTAAPQTDNDASGCPQRVAGRLYRTVPTDAVTQRHLKLTTLPRVTLGS